MPHKSMLPDLTIPADVTVWEWLFESKQFDENARRNPQVGVTNAATKERLSYLEVKQYAEIVSATLKLLYHMETGDTVMLVSPSSVWYPVVVFAVLRNGGKVVGLSPTSTLEEIVHGLRTSEARFVFTAASSADQALTAADSVSLSHDRIFTLEGQHPKLVSTSQLIRNAAMSNKAPSTQAWTLAQGTSNKDVAGFLSFTSGTTGNPKACMLSHHNVIAQSLQMESVTSADVDSVLAVLPFYHVTGLVHMLHLPLLRYKELIMLPKYSFISMLDAITQHRIKELILAPPILIRLVSDPVVRKYDLSFVRRFSSGSAPLPPEILKRLQTTFPKTGFKQGYGMTETCSCVTAHDPSHYDYKFATTCGVILSNTEVKFVDEEGAEVAEGEILVKGPQCALGYLHNEQATQELFDSEGWLRTGDKGYLDPDGCLVVTGRLKDLIKVKGVGVSPVELEDLLLQHPKVRDVCILGHSHPYSGQVPHAYIVLQNGEIGNAEVTNEIVQFVQGRKARPKWLDGVTYIQEVPRAGNGKILRKDLQKKIRLSGVRL